MKPEVVMLVVHELVREDVELQLKRQPEPISKMPRLARLEKSRSVFLHVIKLFERGPPIKSLQVSRQAECGVFVCRAALLGLSPGRMH